jgi:hypothetical protein
MSPQKSSAFVPPPPPAPPNPTFNLYSATIACSNTNPWSRFIPLEIPLDKKKKTDKETKQKKKKGKIKKK